MRRSSWPIAMVVAAALLVGAAAAARVGAADVVPDPGAPVRSSTWYCPHGGGEGWDGSLALADPGPEPVEVRITSLGDRAPTPSETVVVPAGRTLLRPLDTTSPASSTIVEVFDGWVGAGYRVIAGGEAAGLGAEPCLPLPATSWWVSGLSTVQGDRASLVVANPFRSQAVFDVVLFTPDSAPLRDEAWSDLRLAPGRSSALNVSAKVPGKRAVTALIQTTVGRTVVGSLTTSEGGAVRSMIGSPSQAAHWYLPAAGGLGDATLGVGVTGEGAVRFSATLRGEAGPTAASGLLGVRQGALSAGAYQLITSGPSVLDLTTDAGVVVSAGLTAVGGSADLGASADLAATSPIGAPARAWFIPPTAGEEPWFPSMVVGNPGDEDVRVEVVTLPSSEDVAPASATFTVPAGSSGAPPPSFLEADPTAMVLVTASGPVVAAGASTSSGLHGNAWYAIAPGVPAQAWALAAD